MLVLFARFSASNNFIHPICRAFFVFFALSPIFILLVEVVNLHSIAEFWTLVLTVVFLFRNIPVPVKIFPVTLLFLILRYGLDPFDVIPVFLPLFLL